MQGLMQDYPLTTQHILWRMERLYGPKEIVTKTDSGLRRITYLELTRRIHRLAHALTKLGVKQGDRVATLCWNNDRHLELYYAIPCLGAVLHTLNLRLFPAQLEFTIKDADDTIIFVDHSLIPVLNQVAGKIPAVRQIVVIKDEGQELPEHQLGELLDYESLLRDESDEFQWPQLDERAAAAMCYTSGTTGNPKGVVYSHRSQFLHAMAGLQTDTLGISEHDAVLPVVPMFHANSWGLPYTVGAAGAKMIFPDRFAGDPQSLIDLADSEAATLLAGVPTIWINFLAQLRKDGRKLDTVRLVLCGGSAIPRALMEGMEAAGLRMIHAWGMTETSPIGSVGVTRSWLPREHEFDIRLRQGVPVPGIEIRIADLATGVELPWDGQAFGEIQCRGPWVANGYHNNADPTRLTEDGWFRTGDVATVDPDGYISLVDRTKDVIKSGGEWISSVELEGAIMAHPKVLEACVIGVEHPEWQERPIAYVVPRPDAKSDLTEAEIREFLTGKVARWWLPDEIRFIDEVPKTSTFKFDKKALRATAEPLHQPGTAEAPPA